MPQLWLDNELIGINCVASGNWATIWDAIDLKRFRRINVWVYRLNIEPKSERNFSFLENWISRKNLEIQYHTPCNAKRNRGRHTTLTGSKYGIEQQWPVVIHMKSAREKSFISDQSSTFTNEETPQHYASNSLARSSGSRYLSHPQRRYQSEGNAQNTCFSSSSSDNESENDGSINPTICMSDFDCTEHRYELLIKAFHAETPNVQLKSTVSNKP